MEKVLTSAAIWQDFNPAAEPLDVNVLKTHDDGEFVMKSLYFTGRCVSDGKTRVLGKVCAKSGKNPKAAVLFIGNYKRPIDEQELKYWASNGFLAMSIDLAGRRTKGICTLYPESLNYCNSDAASSYFHVGENVKQTKIYEYALNCMRAITYLTKEEKVKTISVVCIKKGVAIGAIVMGTDKRVTNGVAVFGSMYREYPAFNSTQKIVEMDGEELQLRVAYEEKQQVWLAGLAPQSYAIQIKIPLYIIVSANSRYVSADNIDKMYSRLNKSSRMLILPTVMDYMPEEYMSGVVKWCKGNTCDDEISLQQAGVDGCDNYVKVCTSLPQNKVSLWYSRCNGRAMHWVKAPLKKTDGGYIAELSVYKQNSEISAVALTNSVIATSTPLCEMMVAKPQKVKTPTRSIYAGNSDDCLLPMVRRGAPWHGGNKVDYCKGYLDIYGAKNDGMATFVINDPCMRKNEIFTISFDICCSKQQTLKVQAVSDFGFENNTFSTDVQLSGDGKWQRITVEGYRFHCEEDGHQMSDDEKIEMLAFQADDEFIINNIFLV